tara:strand:+ start:5717 stop:6934 length:1218 start_codon:yes stop_codon:yes gene_type:complete
MVTLVNRAKVATATTGTGTITLGAAESGYQTFADAGLVDTNVVRYVIEDGTAWEIGSGTYTATGTTLSRTLDESSTGALLSLTGAAVVYVAATAADLAPVLELYAENYDGTSTLPSATGTNSVALGDSAVSAGTSSTALGTAYASGTDSFAAAIANNTSSYGATGANSIAMGLQAKATGSASLALGRISNASASYAISIGYRSISSGLGSIAIGNQYYLGTPTASGGASIAIGDEAKATQKFSTALGASSSSVIVGKYAYAGGEISGHGDSQTGTLVLRTGTSDATATALTSDNSTAATDNQVILPNNSAYSFSGTIIARQQAADGSNYASWEVKGALLRDATAASTVLGNGIINKLYATAGAAAWAIALTADTTNGGLKIEATGAAATDIRWVATVNTSEVTYA